MTTCPDRDALIEARIDRILTQYRESPNLLALIRHDLGEIADVAVKVCEIPSYFEIMTAVGDQLTLLGKRLGWPRCHCVCDLLPVFGFACDPPNPNRPVVGFCEGTWPIFWGTEWDEDEESTWFNCRTTGVSEYCLTDDEVYRGYLLARRYQALQRYRLEDLQAALAHLWGEDAWAETKRGGIVMLAPGRELTRLEQRELPLALRVLPIAPGVRVEMVFGGASIFGFGDGWTGFCEGGEWRCSVPFDAYECA